MKRFLVLAALAASLAVPASAGVIGCGCNNINGQPIGSIGGGSSGSTPLSRALLAARKDTTPGGLSISKEYKDSAGNTVAIGFSNGNIYSTVTGQQVHTTAADKDRKTGGGPR